MLQLNKTQSEFYDTEEKRGFTSIWSNLRGSLSNFRSDVGIKDDVYNLHREWYGDLTGKRVLDLGCGRGNTLMIEMAQQAEEYLAIDISAEGIAAARRRLDEHGLTDARAEVVDFLSPDFTEKFDVIYAYAVLHHFRYFDAFLEKLSSHLNDGGILIGYDPLNTHPVLRLMRAAYRPFQDDADWEFPFTRETFGIIENHFSIDHMQGILGRSKWHLLPYIVSRKAGTKSGRRAHEYDLEHATARNSDLFSCIHVTMKMTRLG